MFFNSIKSKRWAVKLAIVIVILITACDAGGGASGSDPEITAVNLGEGITISTVIDTDSHSITIEAPPVDLSKLSPVFQVSGGSVENAPTLADGQTVKVPVVSDNGDTVDWNVTVNLAYGMSFKVGGKWVFELHGLKDDNDNIDGLPAASLGTNSRGIVVLCFPEISNSDSNVPQAYIALDDFSETIRRYDKKASFSYEYEEFKKYTYSSAHNDKQDNTVTVLTAGDVGDDLVAAFTFLSENADQVFVVPDITQGFVKAQRVKNDFYQFN